MNKKMWGWQCRSCHTLHRDIVFSFEQPLRISRPCSTCGCEMSLFEFGRESVIVSDPSSTFSSIAIAL